MPKVFWFFFSKKNCFLAWCVGLDPRLLSDQRPITICAGGSAPDKHFFRNCAKTRNRKASPADQWRAHCIVGEESEAD
jgi:hypothetical protein